MSVAEVKEAHPALAKMAPDESFGLDGQTYGWRDQEPSRSTDYRIIGATDAPDARVVLIHASIKTSGVSPAELQQALLEKWGGIAESERNVSPGRDSFSGRSVDATCDVRVEFKGIGNSDELNADLTLFSMQAKQEWQQRQLERPGSGNAKDLLE